MNTLEKVRQRARSDAQTYGYYLNPNPKFLQDLLEGLRTNEERYGYPSCPCRLASGKLEFDRDIICPCDYRDPDVKDFGYCYCGLYVRKDVVEGKKPVSPIPERRPAEKQSRAQAVSVESSATEATEAEEPSSIKKKMWYCKQCGYVCFREDPPYICPICKAKREMFAEITIRTKAQG
ncbi:MAG: ferredoxin:glutaredoxin reductase [Candidatus Bathyarchaeota archaeon]|nr:ferredoxin:glutaredoxin reductase [Candidatus Bathyarchaeota archaeon]